MQQVTKTYDVVEVLLHALSGQLHVPADFHPSKEAPKYVLNRRLGDSTTRTERC
jgi:hypothetical protein